MQTYVVSIPGLTGSLCDAYPKDLQATSGLQKAVLVLGTVNASDFVVAVLVVVGQNRKIVDGPLLMPSVIMDACLISMTHLPLVIGDTRPLLHVVAPVDEGGYP